jgi:hypothetical protein
VDFWISLEGAPESIKEKLVAKPNPKGPFVRYGDIFGHIHPKSGKFIQIHFMPDRVVSINVSETSGISLIHSSILGRYRVSRVQLQD